MGYVRLGTDPLASQALTFHLTTANDLGQLLKQHKGRCVTHVLSSTNTSRVIDPDVPLVQSGDSKSGLSLFLWQTGVFKIYNSPTSKFKQPGYRRPNQRAMLVIYVRI